MSVFIIAEVAQAHDGSIGILHSYIDAVATTGADAIKFQTHIAEAESSLYEPFRVPFSYEDKTRFDYWRRMEFTLDQWKQIKQHCQEVGLVFMSSPFSNAAVDVLEEVGLRKYKIGSGEVTNFLLLKKVATTGKDIILSSGMSSFDELDAAVDFLRPFRNNLAILQCTTQYPTAAKDVGLNVIAEIRSRYRCQVGLSDHSGTIYPSIAAVALGAEIVEVHVSFDKRMFGPDALSSVTVDELQELVKGVKFVETSLGHKVDKNDTSRFYKLKNTFEKSLAVNKTLASGHVIAFEDLDAKKPFGYGIPARQYQEVVGRRLKVEKRRYDFLKEEDLA
ncbi:MAG: N-acetylneuraminate synthase family protein [Planctomycetota bacterium]|jgi:N-acetylneuraminate synthase